MTWCLALQWLLLGCHHIEEALLQCHQRFYSHWACLERLKVVLLCIELVHHCRFASTAMCFGIFCLHSPQYAWSHCFQLVYDRLTVGKLSIQPQQKAQLMNLPRLRCSTCHQRSMPHLHNCQTCQANHLACNYARWTWSQLLQNHRPMLTLGQTGMMAHEWRIDVSCHAGSQHSHDLHDHRTRQRMSITATPHADVTMVSKCSKLCWLGLHCSL